jgi:hypothetical protein
MPQGAEWGSVTLPDPGSVTLKNIYAQLNTSRGALTWDIGPNRVFTVPATLPDGTLCIGDPENGLIVSPVCVLPPTGIGPERRNQP